MTRTTGRYQRTTVAGEAVDAFIPSPLPPARPRLTLEPADLEALNRAEQALGRLTLASEMVPSLDWFVYGFVRKEAVLSSQIEGTQASLVDLLQYEAQALGEPPEDPDVQEVCNYLDALSFARDELGREGGLPLSMRLLNGAHARLMRGTRGSDKHPGEIRRSQNWIGGTRPGNAVFVPPPPESLEELLSAFERYLHQSDPLPPLVRAGLAHVQFETIHPYLDGNGRIGRLLITLLLEHWALLAEPLLYLSLYFKRDRPAYYRRLGAVRTEGDWEGWNRYFLEGVTTIADEAVESAREIFALVSTDRSRALAVPRSSIMSARLFELLPSHPVLSVARTMELLDTTRPTAARAVDRLLEAGVLAETSQRKRDQVFAYQAYLDILGTETEV